VPEDPPPSTTESFRPLPDASWRERAEAVVDHLRSLSGVSRAALAVAASAGVVVVAVLLLRPAGADPSPEATLPRATAPAAPASASPAAVQVVIVQAAGAVAQPGLYRLAAGSRVDDLVHAAGGLAPDADPDRVNLAALLTDGEKVYIPRVGEALPADAAGGATSSPATQPIDLNSASIAQLDTLPGIGPATAQAIIDYRSQHGRFRSVDELLNVRGIGPAKLDELRALVRV
jgi:competence protein ComEA